MKPNCLQNRFARPAAVSARARVLPSHKTAASQIEKPEAALVGQRIALGRVVKSPKYGKGYISDSDGHGVTVRFWRYGYKKFRVKEGGYPFELLDEVRLPKAPAEELDDRCEHGRIRSLCFKCAGLSDEDIKHWGQYRTTERPILRTGAKQYINVRISTNDCVLTSRCKTNGSPIQNAPGSVEKAIIRHMYNDPNSRFQKGGTGYLRIPLGVPRKTRADAPTWLDHRGDFFRTFKASRAVRAELIFRGFYIDDQTDTQIAEALGWKKDSVKKERGDLIRKGNRFFETFADETPP